MPYVRDVNRATRGANAIAAADMAKPSRQRARVQVGRATRARDRQMSAIAQGALSGLPVIVPGQAFKIIQGMWHHATPVPTAPPPILLPPAPVMLPPPIVALPTGPVAKPVTVALPVTSTVVSGGASGAGIATRPIGTAILTAPALPPLPEVPTDTGSSFLANPLLIAGGAALIAYFVFARRGA